MSEDIPFLFLGGEIVPAPDPEVDLLLAAERGDVIRDNKFEASFTIYMLAEDMVRRYHIHGVTGEITATAPDADDREAVTGMLMAKMLRGHGLDMHDFKRLLEMAIMYQPTNKDDVDLIEIANTMHDELGGMD